MNELNLSISTNKENSNKVVLTAAFDSHDEAVAFHSAVASLCEKYSKKPVKAMTSNLLGYVSRGTT